MADEKAIILQPGEDRRVIACNLRRARDGAVSTGAKCYVVRLNPGWGSERVEVLARSRSGRWIRRWERTTNLRDFRIQTLPVEHPLYRDERICDQRIWGYRPDIVEFLGAVAAGASR